jgi:hypothetical protein
VSFARGTPDRHTSHDAPHEVGESALHTPLQSFRPDGHSQLPFLHIFPPLHALPHEPQFLLTVSRSAQISPHYMKSRAHSNLQLPFIHTGCA